MGTTGKHLGYFIMVASGVFLSTMDSSMINIALPYIMQSFSCSLEVVEWVILGYLLTISMTLLLWGKISDRLGKGVVYLIGMLVFSTGSLCCYFSPNIPMLVFSRFVQGIGAAMMMATGPAIIRLVVPPEQIGKWIGSLGIATSIGLMSGPLFGGFILHSFSWRIMFLINVPVSATALLFGWIFIAGTLPRCDKAKNMFDWKGGVYWIFLISIAVVFLNLYDSLTLYSCITGISFFAVLLFFFLRHELSAQDPMLPINLLRNGFYSIAMISATLSFSVLFFVLILMPFYLNYILGLTYDKIGYVMMAIPVSLFVVSPISGRLFDRFGAKYLTSLGMMITTLATFLIAGISPDSSLAEVAWRLSLLGCGQSIFLSPNTASVLAKVSVKHIGITSGLLATCRNIGMLMGVALVGMIFSSLFSYFSGGDNLKNYSSAQLPYFMKAFKYTLYIAASMAFLTALLSLQRE